MRRATAQGAPSSGVVRQDDAFERYTVGDGACCRGVELALETMREGETAFFHVRVRRLKPSMWRWRRILDRDRCSCRADARDIRGRKEAQASKVARPS